MDLRKFSTNKIRHSFEELCLFLIVDDRLLVLTGRRISVAANAHLGRDTCVPRSGYMCTSVGVHAYLGRGTCVPRSGYMRTSVGVHAYLGRGTMTIKSL